MFPRTSIRTRWSSTRDSFCEATKAMNGTRNNILGALNKKHTCRKWNYDLGARTPPVPHPPVPVPHPNLPGSRIRAAAAVQQLARPASAWSRASLARAVRQNAPALHCCPHSSTRCERRSSRCPRGRTDTSGASVGMSCRPSCHEGDACRRGCPPSLHPSQSRSDTSEAPRRA